MAANKPVNPMEEMESVYIPMVSGEDPVVYVGLNGKAWTIPRDQHVQVPRPVANILYRSQDAKRAARLYSDEQQRLMRESLKDPVI